LTKNAFNNDELVESLFFGEVVGVLLSELLYCVGEMRFTAMVDTMEDCVDNFM